MIVGETRAGDGDRRVGLAVNGATVDTCTTTASSASARTYPFALCLLLSAYSSARAAGEICVFEYKL